MDTPTLDPTAVRDACGWLHTTRFLTTAAELHHLPAAATPEVAFVGRSNVGKSTAINALVQQTRLAFSSKRPGRTRDINLFAVGRQGQTDMLLADLPGYGYAAVSQDDKERWQRILKTYLATRTSLRGVVLLCDSRHGLRALDLALRDVLTPRIQAGLQLLILMTKSDKLTRAQQAEALGMARAQAQGGQVLLFSSPKRRGLEEASLWLAQRREPQATPTGGTATPTNKETS